MPWITQMVYFALLFLGIVLALYISFWVLLAVFSIGVVLVVWGQAKQFLLKKGILNPTPGIRQPLDGEYEAHENVTLIEGDYKRVDSE